MRGKSEAGEEMGKRWGRDGEEMEKRWGRDGEEMEKRWRRDGEEMERRQLILSLFEGDEAF